jgi:hypothetical protein
VRDLLRSALDGRYRIERELGQGGMGAVYLAHDLRLDRPVAIKVLPPELAAHAELRERFLRETRVAAGFSHPNIVPVHAVEEHGDLLCFVMGFVDGETLGQRVRRAGPLNAAEAVRLLQEVAWALSYAHGRGVVHRDIKPDNILIERATGRALVTDFGIARSTATTGATLTRVGEVVGTPEFMSPEQAAGERLDGRSDIYSLGVVGFFAVTGRLPFTADSAAALMAMHLTQPAPHVATLRPDLPPALAAVIDRCLEKDPARRMESGEALAAALDPLRSARREIAPALRLFQVQAVQALRAVAIVALLEVTLYSANPFGNHVVVLIIGAAITWGILGQMVGRARVLLAAGFTFDDARAGLLAVMEERTEAHAQELADPRTHRRNRRRQAVVIGGGLYGVLGWTYVFRHMRERIGPNTYVIRLPGTIIWFSCAGMIGLSLALLIMNSSRTTAIDRFLTWVWSGPAGRLGFRLAARGVRASASVAPGGAPSTSAAHAVIDSLPAGMRRELSDARRRIEALERARHASVVRRRSLDAAIAEAGSPTTAGDPALGGRRADLLGDLTRARDEAIARHDRLAAALENVRLQLLRYRGGVGSQAEVIAELGLAEALTREPALNPEA